MSTGGFTVPIQHSALGTQHWLVRHWLALLNLGVAVFVGLPVAAPALMAAGWHGPALLIYALYHGVCHQWPGRSYFLFGPQVVHSMDELQRTGVGMASDFVGNAALGWKVAYCERDLAIYTTALLAGLLYAVLRRRARPLPWPVFLACLVPIAVDGFSQLVGLRESSWELRTLTGALTGFAGVWLVYPRIAEALRSTGAPRAAMSRPSMSETPPPDDARRPATPCEPAAVAAYSSAPAGEATALSPPLVADA